ncbi:hypothetical protein GQ42DRAFT_154028 [Ramicandelaber brevisporus]|nr:hypothetical protein GQ42DRAFT_154028 [Ramicandelaber brevisporus]
MIRPTNSRASSIIRFGSFKRTFAKKHRPPPPPPLLPSSSVSEANGDAEEDEGYHSEMDPLVHIGLQRQHYRHRGQDLHRIVTIIAGLERQAYKELKPPDIKDMCKTMKTSFGCKGQVINEFEGLGMVIQLDGDQRSRARQFLFEEDFVQKDRIVVHRSRPRLSNSQTV